MKQPPPAATSGPPEASPGDGDGDPTDDGPRGARGREEPRDEPPAAGPRPGETGTGEGPGRPADEDPTDPADPADPTDPAFAGDAVSGPRPRQLRRDGRQRVLGGVCGGLGRYCDIDPVIFRVVLGVLAVTGGFGMIFYGFAWLLVPAEGEEESEGRRLLGGRVDGAALTAVFLALIGCGLFLTVLNSTGTLAFAAQLAIAATGVAVWSRRRTAAPPEGAPGVVGSAASAHAVPDAPPETKAPPVPEAPSWWRDPPARQGASGPDGAEEPGYLWGPEDALDDGPGRDKGRRSRRSRTTDGPRSIGGTLFGVAAVACYMGIQLSWAHHPLGTSLQIGLVAALGVFGVGLVLSSCLGRTGFGTVFLTAVTALLLAASAALPEHIGTDWRRTTWQPMTVAAVEPRYELGSGVAVVDLSRLALEPGQTVSTTAEVGVGKARVIVPAGVEVRLRAEAGLGDIRLPGDPKNDIDLSPGQERNAVLPAPRPAGPAGPGPTGSGTAGSGTAGSGPTGPGTAEKAGTVELFIQVGIGQVEVARAAS
ncbi:PspC domain-containing protein [Streptomyces sp. NPDC059248]|uniref:PspC domain-containing protein n=1 Tax=Streptomyces sp. NPDC059248 TaxID=3346791 RepID=UPI003678E36D